MKTLNSITITELEERLEMSGINHPSCIIVSITL